MATVDLSNEQPSGFNWEVYRDTFAPQPTRQIVRGWERAPVAAHAPRLQGHKIWKRPGNKTRKDRGAQDDTQAELEKEGAGARKKLRMTGAKENIGSAPWMEAQRDRENGGAVSLLSKEMAEPAERSVAHDAADSTLKFVPRKRTNKNHVITPRKPLRQTTLNGQAQTQSETVVPEENAGKSPRKRRPLRKSTRRLTRSVLEVSAESPSIQSLAEKSSDISENLGEAAKLVKGSGEPAELALETVHEQIAEATSIEETSEPINMANTPKPNGSSVAVIVSAEPQTGSQVKTPKSGQKGQHEISEKGPEHTQITKTPKSSKKMTTDHAQEKPESVTLAKTPKSINNGSADGSKAGIEASYAVQTPQSSKKTTADNAHAETENIHSTKIPKPGKKPLRRSTRNTRASSVSIDGPAMPEFDSAQTPEVTLSILTSQEESPNFAESQTVVSAQALSGSNLQPESESIAGPYRMADEDSMIAKDKEDFAIENQKEEIITDTLLDQERSEHDSAAANLPVEHTTEPEESEATKDISQLESKDLEDAREALVPEAATPKTEGKSDVVEPEALVEASSEEPVPVQTILNPTKPSRLADSPLSEASESSLVEFSPEPTTRTLQFDLQSDFTSLQANEVASASFVDNPDASATVDESTQITEDIVETSTPDPTTTELTEAISNNASSVSYDHDDTDMLRNFLTRVKANKAAKVEDSPKRKRSRPHSPLRLPLADADNNSSPQQDTNDEFDLGLTKVSSPTKRRKRGDIALEDEGVTEPRSIRRSGRTRLPVKAPPAAPSFIPVRRMGQDGDNSITLKRSEEKELAALTRVNTRKNKGGALSAPEVLAKKAEEKDDPILRQRLLKEVFDDKAQKQGKKKGKSVIWAEELAQFQTTDGRRPEKEKEKEKTEVKEEKKKSEVRVGIRSKIALGVAVNGTPARKRKVKGRT